MCTSPTSFSDWFVFYCISFLYIISAISSIAYSGYQLHGLHIYKLLGSLIKPANHNGNENVAKAWFTLTTQAQAQATYADSVTC